MGSQHREVAAATVGFLNERCVDGVESACLAVIGGIESLQFEDLKETPVLTLMRDQKVRCVDGNAKSCNFVGLFCALGWEGNPPDHSCAVEYLTLSCNAGNARGCGLLESRWSWPEQEKDGKQQ